MSTTKDTVTYAAMDRQGRSLPHPAPSHSPIHPLNQPVQRMLWPRFHVTLQPQQNWVWHLIPTETCLNVCRERKGKLGISTSTWSTPLES